MSARDVNAASTLWLVATPEGKHPRVLRATSARGAVLGRVKDDEDVVVDGVWAAWRLGNFPAQFDVDGLDGACEARELGRSHV